MPFYDAQLLEYLKLMRRRFGLIINLSAPLLKRGVKRLICTFH